jgi:hypothetical protein
MNVQTRPVHREYVPVAFGVLLEITLNQKSGGPFMIDECMTFERKKKKTKNEKSN